MSARRITLSDVAKMARVSRFVAGHVLNQGQGNTRVSQEVAEKVRQAARKLNYRPNRAAHMLRGKRSQLFGLLVASAGDPLRSFLVQYLDAEAVKLGCQIIIANTIGKTEVGPDQFDHYVDEFSRLGVDGVFCAVHRWFGGDRQALLTQHPHTVFYEDPGLKGAVFVAPDRELAMRLAVRHLRQRGRKRIGLAVMSLSRPNHQARRRGYEAELAASGIKPDARLIFNGEPHGLAYAWHDEAERRWQFADKVIEQAVEQLVVEQQADAVITHDDFWAAALIRELRRRGIEVPGQVAVMGFLNHYLADWIDPPLTTVDPQYQQSARLMMERMSALIEEQKNITSTLVEPRLIVREST